MEEAIFIVVTYTVLMYLMAKKGLDNAFDVCQNYFDLKRDDPKYGNCIGYFNADSASRYAFE